MKTVIAAAALALVATAAVASDQPAYGPMVTADQAQKIIATGIAEARKANLTMAFTVVEPSGALVAFHKMDGTQYGATKASQGKAVTAAEFRRSTKAVTEAIVANPGVLTLGVNGVEGGLPLFVDGKVIGALGISGGTAVQDGQIAGATLAAAGFAAK